EAAPAVIVVHRHHERLHRNAIAAPHVGDVAADIDHLGGEFVAENLRQGCSGEHVRRRRCHDRPGDIFVEVGAANSGPQRLHQQLVRPHLLRLTHGFDADIPSSVVTNSLHECIPPHTSIIAPGARTMLPCHILLVLLTNYRHRSKSANENAKLGAWEPQYPVFSLHWGTRCPNRRRSTMTPRQGAMTIDRMKDISVFVHVAEAKSFTAASERIGLSRSAVGKSIVRLEDRLRVRLLQRTTRSVSLTSEGAAFHERCVRLLADLDEAEM